MRGVASDLVARGIELEIFEPADSWSRLNLVENYGEEPIRRFHSCYPTLDSTAYNLNSLDLDQKLDGVDLVLVHEWNDPALIAAVLVYGASLQQAYEKLGWGNRIFVWHEAADTKVFYPRPVTEKSGDLVWIGNWGDDERTRELQEFLVQPASDLHLSGDIYGVRYPEYAIADVTQAGLRYQGWLPKFELPGIFARHRVTVHVPRRPYAAQLRGIPTIRPFEALACGIPLISAPWEDSEGLFRPGTDYLIARSGAEMKTHLRDVLASNELASTLAKNGIETIAARHTCRHRVDDLLGFYNRVHAAPSVESAQPSFKDKDLQLCR